MTIAEHPVKPSRRGVVRGGESHSVQVVIIGGHTVSVDDVQSWQEILRSNPGLEHMVRFNQNKPLLRHRRQSLVRRIISKINSFFN